MKKEWTKTELQYVLHTVRNWINKCGFETFHHGKLKHIGTVDKLENILGLPYTSSGRAATIYVCNTLLYLDKEKHFIVSCFEMDENNVIYAVCVGRGDGAESETFVPINQ
jgi:hypothetical protein